jgi:hypothetical protein
MKNLTFITRFRVQAAAKRREEEEASRKDLMRIAEKLSGRNLFPDRVARANEYLRRLALTDKRFTPVSA